MKRPPSPRGGQNTIANMLGRGASFAEIDRARAALERDDRAGDREHWVRADDPAPRPAQGDLFAS